MLSANQLKPYKATTSSSIAGKYGGKKILCSQQALPIFNNLVSLAKNGNYWAGLVVRGIEGLNSGKLHLDNIYINEKKSLAYGKGVFHIVLPGVTASLEEHPNGSYILQTIKADANYQKLQRDSERPGLWRVDKNTGTEPEFQPDGMVLNKEYRPVVISDMANDDAKTIAIIARDDLTKTDGTIKNIVRNSGFDLHYTPGGSGIIGLKKAQNALATAKDSTITQSAMLLANTMYQARKIEGVLWYSDWGGSAVLTRAMEILHHEKNISLVNHSIYMNRPTTKAKYALELGEKLGLTPNANGVNAGLNYKEIMGNIMVSDVSTSGSLKASAFGVGTASTAFAIAGASVTTSGLVGIAGALFFVGNAVKSGAKNLSGKKYK